jgi:hypothetical protein
MAKFNASENDPIELLKEDHEKVKGLFEEFEKAEEPEEKERIVKEAIMELKIHAMIEEEIFYPKVREENSGDEETEDMMDEAIEEHHAVKLLIGELEKMGPEEERYDAKFTVLAENVKHHIEEEEGEVFPDIESSEEEWQEVGQQMKDRKEELQGKYQEEGDVQSKNRRSESRHTKASSAKKSGGAKSKKRGRAKSRS